MNQTAELQRFATYGMTGVIWIVQLVHYPSFGYVAADRFAAFSQFHRASIGLVVMPLMLLEAITAVLLLTRSGPGTPRPAFLLNVILLVLIWGITFFISVPLHEKLAHGFDAQSIHRLTQTNWLRTALWSVRSGLLFIVLR